MIRGHLHAEGRITKARHGERRARRKGEVGECLQPGIEVDDRAGDTAHADKVKLATHQVARHHEQLAGLRLIARARQGHRRAPDVEGVPEAVQPEPPAQRVGRRRGFEEAHPFRPQADVAAAARPIRGHRPQIRHVRLAADQIPLRTRFSAHHEVPILARAKRGAVNHEAVRADALGLEQVGGQTRRRSFREINVRLAGGHVQGRAPRRQRRVLGGKLEVVVARNGIGMGVNLRAEMGKPRIPRQCREADQFRPQTVARGSGRLINADKIRAGCQFVRGKRNHVVRLREAAPEIGAGGRQRILPHIEVGIVAGRIEHHAPARQADRHFDAIVMPAQGRQIAGRGRGERLGRRGRRRAQAGKIGRHGDGEWMGQRTDRRTHPQKITGRRQLRRLQVEGICLTVEGGDEIVVCIRGCGPRAQQQMRIRGRGPADADGDVGHARGDGDGKVARRPRSIAAGERVRLCG